MKNVQSCILPCYEEDLALLAILSSGEVEVINSVAAFIWR